MAAGLGLSSDRATEAAGGEDFARDQLENARRVEVARAGTQLSPRRLTARRPLRPVAALVIGDPIPVTGRLEDDDDVNALTGRVMSEITALVERARALAGERASQSGGGASQSA